MSRYLFTCRCTTIAPELSGQALLKDRQFARFFISCSCGLSSELHFVRLAMMARGIYRSIGDRISSSFACSLSQRHREKRNSSIVIANLVVGIAIVAFLIASLPYIGLGPESISQGTKPSERANFTRTLLCSLEQISYPQKNKEYAF